MIKTTKFLCQRILFTVIKALELRVNKLASNKTDQLKIKGQSMKFQNFVIACDSTNTDGVFTYACK